MSKCENTNCGYDPSSLGKVESANIKLHNRSACVETEDPLVTFFYLLIRDHLPVGVVEKLVREVESDIPPVRFTNGWTAQYAKYLAERIGVVQR